MRLDSKETEEMISSLVGEETLKIINLLKKKKKLSEIALSNYLKKDIKIIRSLIYKLSNYNLVYSTKEKDKEKGWYIFYWSLNPKEIEYLYFKKKKEKLEKLKEELNKIKGLIFSCSKQCVLLDFDQASEFEFHCPECGGLVEQTYNSKAEKELIKRIEKLEKELGLKKKK